MRISQGKSRGQLVSLSPSQRLPCCSAEPRPGDTPPPGDSVPNSSGVPRNHRTTEPRNHGSQEQDWFLGSHYSFVVVLKLPRDGTHWLWLSLGKTSKASLLSFLFLERPPSSPLGEACLEPSSQLPGRFSTPSRGLREATSSHQNLPLLVTPKPRDFEASGLILTN